MRRKRFDFLEKDVLAVDLSEELIINTNCFIQLTYTQKKNLFISKYVRNRIPVLQKQPFVFYNQSANMILTQRTFAVIKCSKKLRTRACPHDICPEIVLRSQDEYILENLATIHDGAVFSCGRKGIILRVGIRSFMIPRRKHIFFH